MDGRTFRIIRVDFPFVLRDLRSDPLLPVCTPRDQVRSLANGATAPVGLSLYKERRAASTNTHPHCEPPWEPSSACS
jgi:hypothetical protein